MDFVNFLFKHTKLFVLGLVVLSLCIIGITYSYLAYSYQNDVVIKGNVVNVDATLTVERVVGSNAGMVPLISSHLTNAINGVGSDNGACVDANGNLACQVYKITITNNGAKLDNLRGIIELHSTGSGTYKNLKWQELTNPTTVKEDSVVNGMNRSLLVSDLSLNVKEEKIFYIAVWISEEDVDQTSIDKGSFGGTVTFETYTGTAVDSSITDVIKSGAVLDNISSTYVTSSTGINFANPSSDTNGKGVYILSGTENDTYPIYYYRGAVDNNNVLFANFCWKIVRTTSTGGVKLIYNGTPNDGSCDNTGTSSQIGTSTFNSSHNSPAYVGYMYGDKYTYSSKSMSSVTDTYYYGNDVTYSDGTYTLTNTISSASWSSIYNGGLNSNHYTCFSTGTTCSSVYYIYYTNSSTAYYIVLANGKKVEDALSEMLSSSSNTTSSTIKTSIDTWYSNNLTSYTENLEDTVWCNDRSIGELNGWNPNGGSTTSYLRFSSYTRNITNKVPDLTCTNMVDRFTTDSLNGNGNLTYPVGLLTADEMVLGGSSLDGSTWDTYLKSGSWYWSGAPCDFDRDGADGFSLDSSGDLGFSNVFGSGGVRPSVSLGSGISLVSGSGTVSDPYVIQ